MFSAASPTTLKGERNVRRRKEGTHHHYIDENRPRLTHAHDLSFSLLFRKIKYTNTAEAVRPILDLPPFASYV